MQWSCVFSPDVAVCTVELATMVPGAIVQPDRIQQIRHWGRTKVGNPAFDDQFLVNTGDAGFIRQILTSDVQQRIMMRDDWVFWLGENLFACVAKGKSRSIDEVSSRVSEVLGIVTAIPGTVMPSQVNYSADDLVARISRLDDVNDAIAFLQSLTPDERERLARAAGRVRRRPDARGSPGPVRVPPRGAADAAAGHVQPRGRRVTAAAQARPPATRPG